MEHVVMGTHMKSKMWKGGKIVKLLNTSHHYKNFSLMLNVFQDKRPNLCCFTFWWKYLKTTHGVFFMRLVHFQEPKCWHFRVSVTFTSPPWGVEALCRIPKFVPRRVRPHTGWKLLLVQRKIQSDLHPTMNNAGLCKDRITHQKVLEE